MPSSAPLVVGVLAVLAGTAYAEPARPRPMMVRRPGAAVRTQDTANVTSRIVYVRRCPANIGCALREGPDNAQTDTSQIVEGGTRTLGGFSQGDQVWNDLLACVKTTFAPFNITITDQDPGDVPHFMNVVGGKVADITSEFPGAGGLAPFDCGEIPNAVVYTFDVYGPDALALCWTSSQEIAHAFGLEHQMLQKDPLTYINGDLPKRFRDVDAACGEYEELSGCTCGGPTQNTYRHIVGMFGPGAPTPPEISFRRPVEGKVIQPGYKVMVDSLDDIRTEKVDIYVDGALVGTTMTPVAGTYELVLPDLGAGAHTIEARGTDVQGVVGTLAINVTQGPPCTPDKGCTGKEVCAGGVCVPGPDEEGGLGEACQGDLECLSHQCADAGESLKHCVESCDVGNANSCPNDFSCLPAGAEGVCWPTPGGGCCDVGGDPRGVLLLGLGVVVVLRRRRRT